MGSQRALLCPHNPTENPCPCAQEGRDWGCGLCQDTGATQHQRCHGLLWQSAEAQGRSRDPKTGQVSRQKQVGPSPALVAPRNIYLYQVEQLHQEKHQFSPGWGIFDSMEPGEGGALRHPRGPVTMWEPRVPALHCMGVFG